MPESPANRRSEFYALTRDALGQAALDLLRCYGGRDAVEIDPQSETACDEFVLAAAVGFAGPSLNGTLAVAVPNPLLEALHPLQNEQGVLIAHGDWIGELGNQLLGRVKNKLVAYGVQMRLGTPAVVEGRDLRLHASGSELIEQRFRCKGNIVCIWLNAVVGEDLALVPTANVTADEGSILLF
jgi:CheY-specific phosphatase CheX